MNMRNFLVLFLSACLFLAAGCTGGGTEVTAPKNIDRSQRPKLDANMQTQKTGGGEVGGVRKADPPPLLD